MSTTVAIVEDNAGICEELQHILAGAPELRCVCVCRNAAAALERIPPLAPEVIVMDIRLPDGSGIECTARIKRVLPETQILMFTINDDTEQIVKSLEAGASGYLLKDTAPAQILTAIREVREKGAPMSPEVARKVIATFHRPSAPAHAAEPLTPREEDVLRGLSEGLLYKEIAQKFGIKIDTVGTHVKSIYRKLHVRSRTQAVMKYLR
jgi:DNA-binding NarL/FixJ family response regulator